MQVMRQRAGMKREAGRSEKTGIFGAVHDKDISRMLRRLLRAAVWVVALSACVEFGMYFVIVKSGLLFRSSMFYYVHYLFLPVLLNGVPVALVYWLRHKGISLRAQAHAVTLLYAWISFVLYTVHLHFTALALCFALPILMTIAFGDILLTTVVAGVTMLLKVISDVCIVWDTLYTPKRLQSENDWINFVISLIALAVLYALTVITIKFEQDKHTRLISYEYERLRLYQESLTDALTGLLNRKGMQLGMQCMSADESGTRYTLVMVDMDHFKRINDTYGHPVGDRYLKALGEILAAVPSAEGFRFGGDEFCLLLHDYTPDETEVCCCGIQRDLGESEVCRTVAPLTVSFGFAEYAPQMAESELIRRADHALYRAKQARGSIVRYDASMDEDAPATQTTNEQQPTG